MNRHDKKKRTKRIIRATLFALAMTAFSATIYTTQLKNVSVNYLGESVTFKTFAGTISAALEEQNIDINEDDEVSTDINNKLRKNNHISIMKKPVILAMAEPIVQEPKQEEVKPVIEEPKKEIKPATVPKKATVTPTSRGVARSSWGPDVNKAESGILETADGQVIEYSDVMQLEATAYCACYSCCGKWPGNKWYGITATGTLAKVGTIAVDPRIIPLGSKVYVEGLGGANNYGFATAEDTGGAIKGMIIDLYFDTHKETVNWGRQQVKVYILK